MNQFQAASHGDLERVKELVTEQNVRFDNGWAAGGLSVLHTACQGGNVHVVEWLLKRGADVNARESNGESPLHSAALLCHPRCIQVLLDAGADAGQLSRNERLPLHNAHSSAECAALLIAAHPHGVNAVNKDGRTPLHFAAEHGTAGVCSLLLNAGSFVDAVDKLGHGRTPLWYALCNNQRGNAEVLLIRGAQLDRVKLDKKYLKVIPEWTGSFIARRNSCRSSCWAMLELARRRSRVIGAHSRDVLGIISRMVWHSCRDESWKP